MAGLPPRVDRVRVRAWAGTMYLAVLAIIVGQALLCGSWGALGYAGIVLLAVALAVLGYEQRTLELELGDEYRRNVRGWVPRLRPWTGEAFTRTPARE